MTEALPPLEVAASEITAPGPGAPESLAGPPPEAVVPGDPGVLESVLGGTPVDQTAEAPGLTAYLVHLVEGLLGWLSNLLALTARPINALFGAAGWVGRAVIIVALAALLIWLVRTVYKIRRNRAAAGGAELLELGSRSEPETGRSAASWKQAIERCLARGDVAAALEAVWWWIATSLLPGRADAAWTGRELVLRADRGDLLAPIRILDRMAYGPTLPGADGVRDLVRRLEGELG